MNDARLFRNIATICELMEGDQVLEVKMIAQEENMDKVREIREKLLADPAFMERARLAVMPVSDFELIEDTTRIDTRTPREYDNSQIVEFKYE